MNSELPKPLHEYGYTKDQVKEIYRSRKIHYKTFWKAFGVNTCMRDEKLGTIFYPCDIERALYKLRQPGGKFHLED